MPFTGQRQPDCEHPHRADYSLPFIPMMERWIFNFWRTPNDPHIQQILLLIQLSLDHDFLYNLIRQRCVKEREEFSIADMILLVPQLQFYFANNYLWEIQQFQRNGTLIV